MKKAILSTLAGLALVASLAAPAFAMGDGSVRMICRGGGCPIGVDLNPQPLPPGIYTPDVHAQPPGSRRLADTLRGNAN